MLSHVFYLYCNCWYNAFMDKQEVKKPQMSQNIENNEFLQSAEWFKFQEAFGRRTFSVSEAGFSANIVEHVLPVVGRYFYVPRGPVTSTKVEEFSISNNQFSNKSQNSNINDQIEYGMRELVDLAKKENAGWIRIEPKTEGILEILRNTVEIDGNSLKIVKAPYDVQPKEVFKIDISKPEDQLLSEMKSKTRYNIGIARKRGVIVKKNDANPRINANQLIANNTNINAFLKLTKEMAERQGIVPHPEEYYRKMFETFPKEMLSLYVAKYDDKIIAANLILFYGDTATYLHGASSNEHRNVMAPFLLQWHAILDAKKKGCKWYDFGGIKTTNNKQQTTNNWEGITKFKLGFSPETEPVVFPGTYDIIVNPRQCALYKGLQKAKMFLKKIRR